MMRVYARHRIYEFYEGSYGLVWYDTFFRCLRPFKGVLS